VVVRPLEVEERMRRHQLRFGDGVMAADVDGGIGVVSAV
jgi:hypothetical protein